MSYRGRPSETWTPEQRRRHSESVKATHPGPNAGSFFSGQTPWNKGKPNPEAIARMNAARKGKPAHNKGIPMSEEQKAKVSASRKGKSTGPRPESTRLAISAGRKRHVEESVDCRCAACLVPRSPTKIEDVLINVILAEFPEVVSEAPFGRYRVDAYLPPPYHLGFEADGERFHRSGRDSIRDAELLRRFGLPIVRLTCKELIAASAGG